MSTLHYSDIGHDAATGPVALWWIDRSGAVHEEQRDTPPLPPALFESSLEHPEHEVAPQPAPVAFGRVEMDSPRGTIRLLGLNSARQVGRVLDALDAHYPGKVWYVFNHAA